MRKVVIAGVVATTGDRAAIEAAGGSAPVLPAAEKPGKLKKKADRA